MNSTIEIQKTVIATLEAEKDILDKRATDLYWLYAGLQYELRNLPSKEEYIFLQNRVNELEQKLKDIGGLL